MFSFLKIVEIPPTRIVTVTTQLSKQALIDKLSSDTLEQIPKISFKERHKFIGEVNTSGFEVTYTNTDHELAKRHQTFPVKVEGTFSENKSKNLLLKITLEKSQGRLLRLMHRLVIFWWSIWTPATILLYPILLKQDGTIFTQSIMMPLGVIIIPIAFSPMKKAPRRSLDCAQEYLSEYLNI